MGICCYPLLDELNCFLGHVFLLTGDFFSFLLLF